MIAIVAKGTAGARIKILFLMKNSPLSGIVFVLCQDVIELFVWVLCPLANDISKVKRVFPEDQHDDNLENERNVGKQSDESAQLVLISSILFIFFGCASLDHEKGDEVVDPGHCD